jgi:hypothetical protein
MMSKIWQIDEGFKPFFHYHIEKTNVLRQSAVSRNSGNAVSCNTGNAQLAVIPAMRSQF